MAILVVESLLAMPGERVTLYALIAAITVLPALYSSRSRRIWSVIVTVLVLGLLIWDHQAGRQYPHIPDPATKR
jgi:hypothetical protein